jgi:hypothetical protein
LRQCKNNYYTFEIEEIYAQKLRNFKLYQLIYFTLIQVKVTIDWSKYLNTKIDKKQLLVLLKQIIKLIFSRKFLNLYKLKVTIVDSISKKHIKALSNFLLSNSRFMLVLESDAIITDKKIFNSSIIKIMNFAKEHEGTFAILGTSYSLKKLSAEKIKYLLVDGLRIYEKPLTNTVVAYVLDKRAAAIMKNSIDSYSKSFPFLSYDWLVNWVFSQLHTHTELITGIEVLDSSIKHGSIIGTSKSWQ